MMSTPVLFLAFCLIGFASSQTIGEGKCPDPPVKKGFNSTNYLGTWYEIERTRFVIYELEQKCNQATYTQKANGRIGVENLAYSTATNETVGAIAEAYPPNPQEPAKLVVDFGTGGTNYWVLDTDYVNFSLVYSCAPVEDAPNSFGDTIWILGRTRVLPSSLVSSLKDYLKKLNIRTEPMGPTDQTNCE